MSQFFNFKNLGNKAIVNEREERVANAEKNNARFNQSWEKNEDIEKVRMFREEERLQSLRRGLIDDGGESKVIFGDSIEKASDWVDAKCQPGDSSEMDKEIKNSDKTFSFESELLSVNDKTIDPNNFSLSDLDGIQNDKKTMSDFSDEEWKNYKLSEQDKFLMKSLIKNYANISI